MLSTEYIILLVLLIIYCLKHNSKPLGIIVVGYMILLGMMRGLEVGTDHLGYFDDFLLLKKFDHYNQIIRHRWEEGFVACILLFKEFSNDYLTFSSLLFPPTVLGLVYFIRKNKIPLAYALMLMFLLGIYFTAYNAMRQFLALAIILAFVDFVYQKKYVKFAIVTLITALLFHHSTVILLLLIPFHMYSTKHEICNKKTLYIAIITSWCIFFVGKTFMQNVLTAITAMSAMNEFDGYIKGWNEEGIGNLIASMYTIYTLLLIYCQGQKQTSFVSICFSSFTILFNIFQMMSTQSGRVAFPFLCFWMIAIPVALMDKTTKHRKILYLATVVFCITYFMRNFYFSNQHEVNPYYWRTF